MIGESVTYPSTCEACGAPADCDPGETLVDGQVHWDITRHCPTCGLHIITCGRSEVPPDLRERLLTAHGPARLHLQDPSTSPVLLMKTLRATLALDLLQAKAMAHRIRTGTQTGTLTEIHSLAHHLHQAGIPTTTHRP